MGRPHPNSACLIFLAVTQLAQKLASMLSGRQWRCSSVRFPPPMYENRIDFWAPGFRLAIGGIWEPVHGTYVYLSFKNIYINTYILKIFLEIK